MSKMALGLQAWKEKGYFVISCIGRWWCCLGEQVDYMVSSR